MSLRPLTVRGLAGLLALATAAAACGGPATVPPGKVQTEIARALAATVTAFTPTAAPPTTTTTPAPTQTPRATVTPRPTNTPRPTATPDQGSQASPFPYGQERTLQSTLADGRTSEVSFVVMEVIRGPEADAIVRRANLFNDEPPAGASWMLIKLRVTLQSGAAFSIDASDVAVVSGGQLFSGLQLAVCCTGDVGYPELDASIAAPQTSVDGWVIRPALLADPRPLLVLGLNAFEPDLDEGLFFALTQD